MDDDCDPANKKEFNEDNQLPKSISVSSNGIVVVGFPEYEDVNPSASPSSRPSSSPSDGPSISTAPSTLPSRGPSVVPSNRPSTRQPVNMRHLVEVNEDDVFGLVKIYNMADTMIMSPIAIHTIFGGNTDRRFGESVAISKDGSTIAIGSPGYSYAGNNKQEQVQVYRYESSEWKKDGDIEPDDGLFNFGGKIGLSDNGNLIAIAAATNGNNGLLDTALVFTKKPSSPWVKVEYSENVKGLFSAGVSIVGDFLEGSQSNIYVLAPAGDMDSGVAIYTAHKVC